MKRPLTETLHLLNRLAFGGRIQDLGNTNSIVWKPQQEALRQLIETAPAYSALKSYSKEFLLDNSEWASVEENRKVYPNSSEEINHNWLRHVADSANAIREKAALFWMHLYL